ncbi:cobaltochelatase CobN subunit [Tamaricihabitans halophyticus]|uniref:Cobaltochelatase CobN subunit n=1 Tax=Tamaricihabitans halophyticus TaxID=1262583 RepID=A0A4R2QUP0_9PSEU|nr:cobaltochelatase subunit CobN [Tamaricihabitans halophyticus]TCP50811.1 cobaltochelatase CobN subunit [Tamaricihabitans halophyticus]
MSVPSEFRANIVLLSTADTDLLAARESGAGYRVGNPARLSAADVPALLDGQDLVVVRLLGGLRAWSEGVSAVLASGIPTVLLGGESTPDAELMAASTVPSGVTAEALSYLVEGGSINLRELAGFLSDTILLTGYGFAPPQPTPFCGLHGAPDMDDSRPTVGIVFYRAHELSGNTGFVDVLAEAVNAAGGNALPIFSGSLRGLAGADERAVELRALLGQCDSVITTVLAAGGAVAADASAGGDEDSWDAGLLAELDVPIVQGMVLTSSRAEWQASDAALTPMDAGMQVAIPEFDGRLIGVPFSFKERDSEEIPVYVADPERASRLAGIATRLASLRRTPPRERKLAVVLSSYPTKHSRVGNAVGLDTPASAVVLLQAVAAAGYDLGTLDPTGLDSDELIHRLIAAGGQDVEWLTEEQLRHAEVRIDQERYRDWFEALPESLGASIREHWGDPPGELYVQDGQIYVAALRFGNVVLLIQPPRGFGENPIAIYHDPDLPPSHQYLAAYRWLDTEFGAHAVIHLGKHGTLEWLPGKGVGLAADDAPDAVLGDLPLIYPFIVNDPGEGTQAKRRGHAVVVDHMIPPMARADTYGEMAKLEQLLDEYAMVQELDPAKLPTLRAQIWELVTSAELHRDLHTEEQPAAEDFDDFVMHIDGYLCEVKDVQIRDGLHILGRAPAGAELVNDVLAVLRARQVFGGTVDALPGLRAALAGHVGLDEDVLLAEPGAVVSAPTALTALVDGPARTGADIVDLLEAIARDLVEALEVGGWDMTTVDDVVAKRLGMPVPAVGKVLRFACAEVVPRLARTTDEVGNVVHALDGGFVPPGPSGSPTRGLVSVLPTGRNFYSVDPKAIPSRNSFDVGSALADSLLHRHREDTGDWPRSVGLTVWGTSAMRTQGDDISELMWLLGTRPTWDAASRRVTGFEVVPLTELGRPRVDVVVRISGFFRDAFPHVVALLDSAIDTVAKLPEEDADNFVAAHYRADLTEHGDERRATTRIFGSKPGAYGAGLLPLIDARNWRTDGDLAEVYATWGGFAYGKGLDGVSARADMETAFRRIQVAAKNVDTREHDIADSDDYFQYHGGMVAMVRQLTGTNPSAYVGDSAVPHAVRTRTLGEETKRVFRARVVNPRWIAAMQRHGYKGAFELAATVDYLFGFDATAGVVDDWMYGKLADSYVFDEQVQRFLRDANPWALRGITERLLEAAERGLWSEPAAATLDDLRAIYLDLEGQLED